MARKIKKELLLEGLGCAHCVVKIEENISKISGVASAFINFPTKTLTIEAGDDSDIDTIVSKSSNIIKKLEPRVRVKERVVSKETKKVLILMGLGCADCATKIEKEVKSLPGVSSATVNFLQKKLIIEANKNELNDIVTKATKIAQRIESGIKVTEEVQQEKDDIVENRNIKILRLGLGAFLFILALVFKFSFWLSFGVYLVSYLLVGGEVLLKAAKNILHGQVFDENFLMSVATIGAFAIREFPEGVAVMLFYQAGEFFQEIAVNRSRKSIAALMDIRPDFANLKTGDSIRKVAPDEINIGDIIIVKPGEKVPLDGKVIDGKSMLDTSALTGESVPREVETGQDILSGSINKNGLLTIEVTKEFGESTVAKILDLVQNAGSKKSPTENFITKFARFYTPIVVFAALALAVVPPLVIPDATFSTWINRALVFLVVSCPCALVISIPLGFFGGIGGASKNGILIKGSNYLEALNNVDTIVFDKTGTLTKGVFKVTEIKPSENISSSELLQSAAFAECYSNHPIAISILKEYGQEIDKNLIKDYDELSGYGLRVKTRHKTIWAGNSKLMDKEKIPYENPDAVGTIVHIAVDNKYAGYIVISDEVKEDSLQALKALKQMGIRKLAMLTGDSITAGEKIARQLGLDEVHAELLPDQKVKELEVLDRQKLSKGKLVFVGDGINDAPVLARADIGVAMGGLGSDAAIEAADVVLMTDEPSKLAKGITIARNTHKIVWQNIILAVGVKVVVLVLGAGGIATLWEAVFADVGVALLAVLNAMRVLKVNNA